MTTKRNTFDRETLLGLLSEVGDELARRGRFAEIAIYGGSALLLHFDDRPATKDVDYVGTGEDDGTLHAAAAVVGGRRGLAEDWFNDAVRMFASQSPERVPFGDFPGHGAGGLRVFLASPRYILAMKILEMRSSMESNDPLDVWNLIDHCGLKDLEEARRLVAGFYPGDEIPPRREAILRDLMEAKRLGRAYDPMLGW